MKRIQEDIKNGTYKKAYLLYGDETYLKIQFKNKLLTGIMPQEDTMNFHHFSGKGIDIQELIDLAETVPFFADRRIFLLEDTGFFKNKCDQLAEYMKELPDYICLIFVESEVDKRNRLYKAVSKEGIAVEFAVQNEKTLLTWGAGILGRAGKKITQKDMEYLLQMTGTDMGIISMEIEKLLAYTEGRDVITHKDIEEICTEQIQNKIFEMVRAVTEKQQKKALDLYQNLLLLKEPPMRILFLLAKQYRQMLAVRRMEESGLTQPEIVTKLGLPSFVVRNIISCSHSYKLSELERAIQDFVDAEEAVKTGRLDEILSVELLIIKYSSSR